MGLLDDAIREHLELKRKHGADSEKIDELEREALGPVRRDRGEAPADATDEAAVVRADDPEPDLEPAAPPEFDVADEPETALEEEQEPAPVAFTDAPAPVPEEAPLTPPPATPAPAEDDPWLVDDTAEQPAAKPEAEPEGDEEEDVLEETPEFLQETPEHDRLWFEQKPPKNFDWDR